MKHADSDKDGIAAASSAVAEVSLKSAYDGSEYADVERSLRGLPGVAAAHLDRTRGVAHVTRGRYHLLRGAERCHLGMTVPDRITQRNTSSDRNRRDWCQDSGRHARDGDGRGDGGG